MFEVVASATHASEEAGSSREDSQYRMPGTPGRVAESREVYKVSSHMSPRQIYHSISGVL